MGGGEASSGMASHETPLLLNANLGCGSLQGAGGSAGGRGPMQAGAKVSISRSLPFLTDACPDYWRLKGESRVTLPLGALVFKKEQQPMTAAPRPLPRWRRIGAPAPRRSLADALDDDGGDSDDSDDAAEEIVVAEPSRRDVVVDVVEEEEDAVEEEEEDAVEEEEEAEEASVAALRARLSCLVDVARAHGLAS